MESERDLTFVCNYIPQPYTFNTIHFLFVGIYLKSVFDQYATPGKDRQGNPSGVDILLRDKAYEASMDIIMKWNDLPE